MYDRKKFRSAQNVTDVSFFVVNGRIIELAQRDIGNEKKGFANASDCLETWDDSDSITAIIAQKDLRQSQNGGITTQKHNIKVPRSTINIQK